MVSQLLLKWLESAHPAVHDLEFKVSGMCVIWREHPRDGVTGFTLFEPRDLTDKLMLKLKSRMAAETSTEVKFHMQVPPFLKHRTEMVQKMAGVIQMPVVYSPFLHLRYLADRFVLRNTLKVANIDDSPVLLKVLRHALEDQSYVKIVGQCSEPLKALSLLQEWQPDVVTMDIQMPKMNGVELVSEVMEKYPLPVIMVSSLSMDEGSLVFEALNSGAFDYIQKPKLEDRTAFTEELHARVLEAAVGKRVRKPMPAANKAKTAFSTNYPSDLIWVLGASTGGTQALTSVFTSLPDKIPPTLVVQHIPPVFSKAFADSLNNLVPFGVKEAQDGDVLQPNHVYIAPGGLQMNVVKRADGKIVIELRDDPPVNRFKPSVDYMFGKVLGLKNLRVVAALLTGMGRDGAQGLLDLKTAGARTIAQDEATCAVYGMPRAAAELGAAEHIVPLDQIALTLMSASTHTALLKPA